VRGSTPLFDCSENIENKIATGEAEEEMDESLWPKSHRPTGGHTAEQVASDVNRVVMARGLASAVTLAK
jgi:hypothetical protein